MVQLFYFDAFYSIINAAIEYASSDISTIRTEWKDTVYGSMQVYIENHIYRQTSSIICTKS